MQKNKTRFSIQVITLTAMLTALQIVLGNLLQIPLLGKQYSLWLLPIAAAGALLGPIPAAIVGCLGDLIGAHLFPAGVYFPGFTLTNTLVGLVCGIVLHRKWSSILRILLAVALSLLLAWLAIHVTKAVIKDGQHDNRRPDRPGRFRAGGFRRGDGVGAADAVPAEEAGGEGGQAQQRHRAHLQAGGSHDGG